MDVKEYQLNPEPRQVNAKNNEGDIYLRIQIGNGQIGGSKVTLNQKIIAKGNISEPTYIGKAEELQENNLEVETNILDVNGLTNVCVFTTTFYNQDNDILFTQINKGEAPECGIASFKGKYLVGLWVIMLTFLVNIGNAVAQKSVDEISFRALETPSSPGFILLDNTPSAIEKPTTPQGFGLSVLGFFDGTGGAMEFAPFWLKSHPELTAEDMYNNHFPILYNLSISGVTVKSDSSHYVAGGLRTRLYQSYGKSNTVKLDSVRGEMEIALADLDIERISELKAGYMDLIEKPIVSIDLATAIGAGSTTNSFKDLELNRWAAWLSFNYRPNTSDFYFTVITRYISNEKFEDYSVKADLLDIGVRLNYDIARFSVSLEYLQRLNLTSDEYDDNRVAIIGSYRISDQYYLTSTLGKNFSEVDNIIALAGINFGFSKSKIKAFEN